MRPRRDFRKVTTPKSVVSSSPGEGSSCGSETKRDRRKAQRPNLFRREDYMNPKTLLSSSLGKDVGFKDNDNDFLYQRYVTNYQAYAKLSSNKD